MRTNSACAACRNESFGLSVAPRAGRDGLFRLKALRGTSPHEFSRPRDRRGASGSDIVSTFQGLEGIALGASVFRGSKVKASQS